jgi:hypothetical protein
MTTCTDCSSVVEGKSLRCEPCKKVHASRRQQRRYVPRKTAKNCLECGVLVTEVSTNGLTKLCSSCKVARGRARCVNYRAGNRLHVSKYNKKYKKEKTTSIAKYNKKYFAENKNQINNRRVGYLPKYHAQNPSAKLWHNMRGRIGQILKDSRKNSPSSRKLLGCSKLMFTDWMKFLFQFNPEFTLDNYGEVWHMDHCIPCAKFDGEDSTDIERCFHWSNIKPMDPEENASKNDTASRSEQLLQWFRAKAFLYHHSHKYLPTTYTITPLIIFTYTS